MISTLRRSFAPAVLVIAAALPAYGQSQNPNCTRLESQLATFDRSAADPARAEQIKRFEEAAASQ